MKGLSPSEIGQLILSVGTHRSERPLSPIEVAKLIQKALEAGERRKEIAIRLHLNGSTIIGRFIRLLSLPPQVQHLIGWGSDPVTLSFSAASGIAQLSSAQDQYALAKASLENQLNRLEITQVVQIRQRSGKPIENCIEEVLNQRPIIEKRHVIVGELLSERLKTELEQVSQLERDSVLQSVLERYVPDIPPLGAQLRDGYFFLIGDDEFHRAIMSLSDGFEKSITEYLMLELRDKD